MDDILADANVLLRFVNSLVLSAVTTLKSEGFRLIDTPQSIRELCNVATWPERVNGLGSSIDQADRTAAVIESQFALLHDTDAMHTTWRRLVVGHEVKGVQVHDARLPALHPRNVSGFVG